MADQEKEAELEELTSVRLTLGFNVDARDIASKTDARQVIKLITELDDELGEWAATILLARHFEQQLKLASQAVPELVAASDEFLLVVLEDETEGV